MNRVLSVKRLLIVIATVVVLGGVALGVHAIQVRRQLGQLHEMANRAAEAAETDPEKLDVAIDMYERYLKYRPKDGDSQRKYVNLLFLKARNDATIWGDVADTVEKFLRQFRDNPDERRKLIDLYLRMGNTASAWVHLDILFNTPNAEYRKDIDLLEKAASYETANKNLPGALRYLDEAVETGKASPKVFARILTLLREHPKLDAPPFPSGKYTDLLLRDARYRGSVEARVVVGRHYLLLPGPAFKDKAREYLEGALAMPGGADNPEALKAAAELELSTTANGDLTPQRVALARAYLERAQAVAPNDARIGIFLADVVAYQGSTPAAVGVLTRAAEGKTAPTDDFLLLIDRLIDLGDDTTAPTLVAKVKKAGAVPALVTYFNGRLAILRATRGGDPKAVVAAWQEGRQLLDAVAPTLAQTPEFHKRAMVGLGRYYQEFDNPDKQYESYRAAVHDDASYIPALIGLADALVKLGKLGSDDPRENPRAIYRDLVVVRKLTGFRRELVRLSLIAFLTRRDDATWAQFIDSLGPEDGRTPEVKVLHAEGLLGKPPQSPEEAAENKAKAVKVLEEVVRDVPGHSTAWLLLAQARDSGKPDAVLAALDAARRQAGDTVDLRLARAAVLVGRANRATATELRSLAQPAPNYTPPQRYRLHLGLGEQALRAAAVLNVQNPADPAPGREMLELAITFFREAANAEPTDLHVRAVLVDIGLEAGRRDVAEAALAEIVAIEEPGGPIGTLARVAMELPDVIKHPDPVRIRALRDLAASAHKRRPGWARACVALGQLDELAGQTDSALANYLEAFDKRSREIIVLRRILDLYRRQGKESLALARLNRAAREVALPDDLERFRVVGNMLRDNLALPTGGRAEIDRLAPPYDENNRRSVDPRVQHLRGVLLAAVGDDEAALAAFRLAVRLDTDNTPDVWTALVSHLVRLGKLDDARRAVEQGEERLRANPKTNRANLLVALAGCYELIEDLTRADARYREAIQAAPAELNPNRELILYLMRTGRAPEADALLRRLGSGQNPALARWARRYRALALAFGPDAYHSRVEALALVRQNLAGSPIRDPEDVKAEAFVLTVDPKTRNDGLKTLEDHAQWLDLTPDEFYRLARIRFNRGEFEKAIDYFEKAVRPRTGVTLEHLSAVVRVHLARNNLSQAERALGRLEASAPRSWEACRERARVRHHQAQAALPDKDRAQQIDREARDMILNFPGNQTPDGTRQRSGPLLEELGFFAEAENLYRKLLGHGPSSHLPLARFLIRRLRSEEAIKLAWEREKDTPTLTTAGILTSAARAKPPGAAAERQIGDWLEAKLREYAGKPEEPGLIGARAEWFDSQGRYDEAIAEFRRAVDRTGGRAAGMVNNLCMLLVLRHPEKADEAIRMMTHLIETRGPQPVFLDTRAVALLHKGGEEATAQAVKDLGLALTQQHSPVYLFHLAWAYDLRPELRSQRRLKLDQAKQAGLTPELLHPLEVAKYQELDKQP